MSLSFGLNASSALEALRDAFDKFKQESSNADLARDCAIKAWHLSDLVFDERLSCRCFRTLKEFQEHVCIACPELAYLRVICNASKHGDHLRKAEPVSSAEVHHGDFSRAFSRDFDTSRLIICLEDGTKVDFEDAMEGAVAYWSEFFFRKGLG